MQKKQRTAIGLAALVTLIGGSLGPAALAQDPVELTFLVDSTDVTIARTQALADAYTAIHPEVTFAFETRPQGAEGDNITKTRLATGEMTDVFWYNSGSLLKALNPSETLVDISGEPCIANLQDSYIPTVSDGEGIFGVPGETAMAGGLLYNKQIYADLGLSVPTTWEEFAANNEAIKAAGIAPVGATFGADSTWTSQLFVLADYYNVQAAIPDFAERVHQQSDQVRHDARCAGWLPASPGGLREGLVSGGLRGSHVRRRSQHARHR